MRRVTDEGFLNNPYRQVRFLDPVRCAGYSYESELYPRTRTSSAQALARNVLPALSCFDQSGSSQLL